MAKTGHRGCRHTFTDSWGTETKSQAALRNDDKCITNSVACKRSTRFRGPGLSLRLRKGFSWGRDIKQKWGRRSERRKESQEEVSPFKGLEAGEATTHEGLLEIQKGKQLPSCVSHKPPEGKCLDLPWEQENMEGPKSGAQWGSCFPWLYNTLQMCFLQEHWSLVWIYCCLKALFCFFFWGSQIGT